MLLQSITYRYDKMQEENELPSKLLFQFVQSLSGTIFLGFSENHGIAALNFYHIDFLWLQNHNIVFVLQGGYGCFVCAQNIYHSLNFLCHFSSINNGMGFHTSDVCICNKIVGKLQKIKDNMIAGLWIVTKI